MTALRIDSTSKSAIFSKLLSLSVISALALVFHVAFGAIRFDSVAAAAARKDSPITIRFGYVQSTTSFPLNLAIRDGFFKKRGLNVIAKPYADFSPLYLGYRSGEIDMGSGGLGSIIELNARGVPIKVIWGSGKMNNDILVRADSPVTDLSQLKGKMIGVLGGAASFSANMFMAITQAYYGFDPLKDGKIQYGASALLASMLQRGEIDAFLSNDPVTAIELSKGRVKSIGEMGSIHAAHGGHHPTVGAVSVSDRLAAEHPEAVSLFLGAWVEGAKVLKADRKAWAELSRTLLGMDDPKIVGLLWERLPRLWALKWDETDVKGEISVLQFIARYAGTGFLEKIPTSAFSTQFVPK